ncbi:MAG: hypothetical protein HQ558_04570 [Candidatus Omnitrophica bacterium]|nr:hypothetical protein [Candidatus Omnitrophota bacterium]
MRHLITIVILLSFVFSAFAVYAAPVGNIATAALLKKGLILKDKEGKFGFILAGEVDNVQNRKIEHQTEKSKSNFYGAKIGAIIADRGIIYGLIGASDAEQEYNISNSEVKWETEYDIAWGVGANVILFENKSQVDKYEITIRLGADAKFMSAKPNVDKMIFDGMEYDSSSSNVSDASLNINNWQAAAEFSFEIYRFIPYIGVKYSDVDGEAKATINGNEYEQDLRAKNKFGFFVGGDIMLTDSISLNAEGRFVDEMAFSANLCARF